MLDTNDPNYQYLFKLLKKDLYDVAKTLPDNEVIKKSTKKTDIIKFIFDNGSEDTVEKRTQSAKTKTKSKNIITQLYGLPQLTDEQQKDLVEKRKVKLYSGTTPFDLVPTDKTNPIIRLEKHQRDFLNSFCFSGIRGAIAFHGVGTGKTNICVSVSNIYLELFPDNKIVFISPPVLLPNFIKTLAAYGLDPRDKRISYYTYDSFYKSDISLKNTLLIVDEAHNFRTIAKQEGEEGYESAQGSKRSADLTDRAIEAHKALMVTGTAFVNKLYDIENLLAIVNGQMPLPEQTFYQLIEDKKTRYDYMKYRISMYFREIDYKTNKKQPHDPNFPFLTEKYIPIVTENKDIQARASKTNPVYSKSRQAGLEEAKKIDYCMKIINDNPNKKYVIYTSFIKGVDKIIEKSGDIPYAVISGDVSIEAKAKAVEQYNNDKIRLLIITKAGSEGVSLLATAGIFIIDGVWNEAAYIQIVARAVRYKSHEKLPVNDRKVTLYKLFVCSPSEESVINALNDEDNKFDFQKYLERISELKKREKELARREGKEFTGRSKIDDSIILANANKYDDFDMAEYSKLKGAAKKEYIEKHGTFMKDRETYLTRELASISDSIPGTDFYMFALQKSKQLIITNFIKSIALIPDAEQAFFDMDLGKQTNDFIKMAVEKGKDEEFIAQNLIRLLKPNIKDAYESLKPTTTNELIKIVEEGRKKAELQKLKNMNRILQEFFTPSHIVQRLIDMSGIKNNQSNDILHVLEPSAGDGAIVKGLIEFMELEKKPMQIDMVEISPKNREELMEAVKEIPGYLNLAEEGDFLKYQPNKSYDYIIMNPPFHLKAIEKYDYDFVQNAFYMLNRGGVLVAVTGQKYLENEDAVAWYKNRGAEIKLETIEWMEKDPDKKLKNLGMEIKKVDVAFIKLRRPISERRR